jgi:ABC-type sugar transport system substrate-binding protein
LTAYPNVKVFIAQSTAHAQGAANAIKALPNVDLKKYGVFAGDMDPSMIPTVTSCADPYKGFVAIGGTSLDVATYEQVKKMLQGVEHPNIINDVLEPITCDFSTLK